MAFLTLAQLQHHRDRNAWKLLADLVWESPESVVFRVPAGTLTDLASTPRLAWFLVPPMDRHIVEPAILHDYLYQCHDTVADDGLTRAQCDAMLSQAIRDCGGKTWYRIIVYTAVRLFGGKAWRGEKTA